jgi:hypothetical protein
MLGRVRWLKRLLIDLPRRSKLAYCLLLDARVPKRNKAMLVAALGVVLNPAIDLPLRLPVVRELDALALTLLTVEVFVNTAPSEVVLEHERLIAEGRSRFDRDLARGRAIVTGLARRLRRSAEPPPGEFVGIAVDRSRDGARELRGATG